MAAWQSVEADPAATHAGHPANLAFGTNGFSALTLDRSALETELQSAPHERIGRLAQKGDVVSLPGPDGRLQRFSMIESPVMEPLLQAEHPEIRTYVGRGIDDPTATISASLTPLGFDASVRSDAGMWYIDPYYHLDQSLYASYYRGALADTHGIFIDHPAPGAQTGAASTETEPASTETGAVTPAAGEQLGTHLRTYRLAVLTDPSFAANAGYVEGDSSTYDLPLAQLAVNTSRVDQLYEQELDVRVLLVNDETDAMLDTFHDAFAPDGPCGTAPCATQSALASCGNLAPIRFILGQTIGAENYDAGHLSISNAGGGLASLGVVGGPNKASGCTGVPNADGDYYDVDYWAHEMGHNWNMNHAFNGDVANCAGNRAGPPVTVEPGSGEMIMSYAGICGSDDLQPHSAPYESTVNVTEAETFMAANKPNVNEVQTIALRHFGGGNEVQVVSFGPGFVTTTGSPSLVAPLTASTFQIEIGGNDSAVIGGAAGGEFAGGASKAYTATGVAAAINGIAGFPGTVSVTSITATGFTVTYSGASAGTDVPDLTLVGLSCGGCPSSVDEVNHGGTFDSFALSYAGSPNTVDFTNGTNYTAAALQAGLQGILPAGATVSVAPFFDSGSLDGRGFQVTFGGSLAGATTAGSAVATLTLTDFTPGASGFAMKTDWGGPQNNHGFTITPTGNHSPVVSTAAGFTIPRLTPFTLTGHATDPDAGQSLTYTWEQIDAGNGLGLVDDAKTKGPLFSAFPTSMAQAGLYDPHAIGSCLPAQNANDENCAASTPRRTFPDMAQIIADDTNARGGSCPMADGIRRQSTAIIECYGEFLPPVGYAGPIHFRLTARDGSLDGGGVASADTTLTLAPSGRNEVQAVALSGYSGSDSYRLTWDGHHSVPITRGQNDTTLGIQTAIQGGNEVQTLTFANFNAALVGDSYRICQAANCSAVLGAGGLPIVESGVPDPLINVKQAIEAIPGFVGTVTVNTASATAGPVIFFEGAAAETDWAPLTVEFGPCATALAPCSATNRETAKGSTGIPGWPSGASVVVSSASDSGTDVRFLSMGDVPPLSVTNGTGGTTGSVSTVIQGKAPVGPFRVTSQAAPIVYRGGSRQTVTWNVAGTDSAPVDTADVRISLSLDGGLTYPIVLARNTANDGKAGVTIPNVTTSHARIRVKAVGNIYFDIDHADITIHKHHATAVVAPSAAGRANPVVADRVA